MKRKKSPLLHGKAGTTSDGNTTPKHLTPYTSSSSLTPAVSPQVATAGSSSSRSIHHSFPSGDDYNSMEEMAEDLASSSYLSNGVMDVNNSLTTGNEPEEVSASDLQKTRAAIDRIQQKVTHTKDLIKVEQTSRDDNVNEYLKLASSCDKQQLQRIKSIFEKKNQKSAQIISQLQKKLDNYYKRIKELETHGLSSSHWQPREVLRDVGQGLKGVGTNIKEGITGFSGGVVGNIKGGLSGLTAATHTAAETVMSKPREFAHLIKNRFGSADNIGSLEKLPEEGNAENGERNLHGSATFTHCSTKYTSDDDSSSVTSGSGQLAAGSSFVSPHHQPLSHGSPPVELSTTAVSTAAVPLVVDLEPILQELRERREECNHMAEKVESLKNQIRQECSRLHQALQEERYRYEHLEEQMNDLIELHQNEIENLKQGLTDMEEKVQYQSEERLRDVHEVMENCQTRISRMEHQQHQNLQQLVTIDNLDNSNARALVLKLINVLLTVLQVVLLLVATVANILMPFIQTRLRILTTSLLILSVVLMWRQWTEITDWGYRWMSHYVQT